MGLTNAQKRKMAKKKAKEKHIRKMANIRRNAGDYRFRLDVFFEGKWTEGVVKFRHLEQVKAHVDTTEARRRAGEEIAPGKVYDLVTGRMVVEIPGSRPKGAAPDKITDGAKADPNVTALPEQKPVELVGVVDEGAPKTGEK